MIIGDLIFPRFVFGQAGVQGFFAEIDEHPHHRLYQYIPGFSFNGMHFVAKTITTDPRIYPDSSNTELRDGYKLKRFLPNSIWVSPKSFFNGYMLNAVGLANPGAFAMFSYHKWQKRKEPFMLSFMPIGKTLSEKTEETEKFCRIILANWKNRPLNFALQVNFSCPNTGHNEKQDPVEIIFILSKIRKMIPGLALIPKFNLSIKPETISKLKKYCDAFCLTNTLGFKEKEDEDWWKKLFPKEKSPLAQRFNGKFNGGLSGAPLFPPLVRWLEEMQEHDKSVTIIAGGGIMTKNDIYRLSQIKIVKGIALGSVTTLRPWRLQSLINYGNEIFGRKYYSNLN